jgi:Putative lumazine-binding
MIRQVVLGIFCVATCGAAIADAAVPGHQPGEEAAILAVVDGFMHAVTEQDAAAMARMQTADGMTYSWRPAKTGGMEIVGRSNAYWADPKNKNPRALRERYWSPNVHIRGGIAQVWAPYEFWIDGKTSHCGIDTFDMVKVGGEWRIANATWTVEPDACAELRPADPADIRPADRFRPAAPAGS